MHWMPTNKDFEIMNQENTDKAREYLGYSTDEWLEKVTKKPPWEQVAFVREILKKIPIESMDDWEHEWPNKVGTYWFYGDRYNDPKHGLQMILCQVHRISNGLMTVGNGQFMYKSELGEKWWFKKAILPEPPKEDGDT